MYWYSVFFEEEEEVIKLLVWTDIISIGNNMILRENLVLTSMSKFSKTTKLSRPTG